MPHASPLPIISYICSGHVKSAPQDVKVYALDDPKCKTRHWGGGSSCFKFTLYVPTLTAADGVLLAEYSYKVAGAAGSNVSPLQEFKTSKVVLRGAKGFSCTHSNKHVDPDPHFLAEADLACALCGPRGSQQPREFNEGVWEWPARVSCSID